MRQVQNEEGAVGAAVDDYYNEDDLDGQDFEDLEPEEMMRMIEMQ